MAEVTLKINGMSCQHCVMRVKKALDAVQGVTAAKVEIGTADVSYDESRTDPAAIRDAVAKSGYTVSN